MDSRPIHPSGIDEYSAGKAVYGRERLGGKTRIITGRPAYGYPGLVETPQYSRYNSAHVLGERDGGVPYCIPPPSGQSRTPHETSRYYVDEPFDANIGSKIPRFSEQRGYHPTASIPFAREPQSYHRRRDSRYEPDELVEVHDDDYREKARHEPHARIARAGSRYEFRHKKAERDESPSGTFFKPVGFLLDDSFELDASLCNRQVYPGVQDYDAQVQRPLSTAKYTSTDVYKKVEKNVLCSKYGGDIFAHGNFTAELTTEQTGIPNLKAGPRQLFRWIHLESQCPSLLSFTGEIQKLSFCSDDEKSDMIALLGHARDFYERPILAPDGARGMYLEPHHREEKVQFDPRMKKQDRSVQLICLPYFSQTPYNPNNISLRSPVHPARTLLQYTYPSTQRKRDLSQIVCKMYSSHRELKEHCFYVPQLWCLILDESLLITCSQLSAPEIQSRIVEEHCVPPSLSPSTAKFLVSNGGGQVWLLPVSSCRHFFLFTVHFLDLSRKFDEEYEVRFQGSVKNRKNWQEFIDKIDTNLVTLTLHRKSAESKAVDYNGPSDTESFSTYESTLTDSSESIQTKGSGKPKGHDNSIDDNTSSDEFTPKEPEDIKIRSEFGDPHVAEISLDSNVLSNTSIVKASKYDFNYCFWVTGTPPRFPATVSTQPVASSSNGEKNTPTPSTIDKSKEEFEVNLLGVRKLLKSIEFFLQSDNPKQLGAYNKCPSHTRTELRSLVKELPPKGWRKAEFVIAALRILHFYIPLQYTSDLIKKYWGSIYSIVEDDKKFKKFIGIQSVKKFNQIALIMARINQTLTGDKSSLLWEIPLPEEFAQAFVQILQFLIFSVTAPTSAGYNYKLWDAINYLIVGERRLKDNAFQMTLPETEAALPTGIAALIINKLLHDHNTGPRDIYAVYHDYYAQLEQDVYMNPYDRSHQQKTNQMLQEIAIIQTVLGQQESCLEDFRSCIDQKARELPLHNPSLRERHFYISNECQTHIVARLNNFTALANLISTLADFNLTRIESNKDRQETAILVFTTVTIIFLPLSFVSSFLGMNTNDIRNLDFNQWIFWACAIPVTILVVSLTFWFAISAESATRTWNKLLSTLAVKDKLDPPPAGLHAARSLPFPPLPVERARQAAYRSVETRPDRYGSRYLAPRPLAMEHVRQRGRLYRRGSFESLMGK